MKYRLIAFAGLEMIGIGVLVGHILHIDFLKSISTEWVTMKPGTALMFCVGATAFVMERGHYLIGCLLQIISTWHVVAFVCVWPLDLIGSGEEIRTLAPGLPSWGTLVAFTCFGLHLMTRQGIWSDIVGVVALTVFAGYMTGIHELTFNVRWSTAMAMHTCIGLIFMSVLRVDGKSPLLFRIVRRLFPNLNKN